MIRFEQKSYYTVDEFRQRCGFGNVQRIYRAIHNKRINGVVQVNGIYLIPLGAIIVDKRVKHGKYAGVSRLIKRNEREKLI